MKPEQQSSVSISRLMANVASSLEQEPLTNELDRAALTLWIGKIFVFFNSLDKQEIAVQEKTLLHIQATSKRSVGYFWNHSFATIVTSATTESDKKTFTISRALKQVARESLDRFRIAIAWFNICIASRSNRVILFDNRDIDPNKVARFFEKKAYLTTNTAPVFLASAPNIIDTPASRVMELSSIGSKRAKAIHSICTKAIEISISNILTKTHDALVPLSSVKLALTQLENLLPVELLNKPSCSQRLMKMIVRSYSKHPVTILDSCAITLRNRCFLTVSHTHTCEYYGIQHGGQYGEIRSPQTALEITNPAYDQGFLGWGFGLEHADFRRAPRPSNRISVLGPSAILYPQSMPSGLLDNCSSDDRTRSLRDSSKDLLETVLCRLNEPYWVKSHPKSPRSSFSNVKEEDLIAGSHKPGVDRASIKLVVFDAPGQTFFFDCVRNRVPCLFCFALSAYDLTRSGVLYFERLESVGMFVNLDTNFADTQSKLILSIKALLAQEGVLTPSPADHF